MTDKEPIDKMIELSEDLGLYKEQIIIDGVDVSKCICCLRICTTTKKPEAICNEYAYCSQTPNCYFKQLTRKTKEYNDLLEQHKELDDRVNRMIEEKYNLCRECEELKERLNAKESN